jgi:glycosyltransferase involved in cell wall biosynthesis
MTPTTPPSPEIPRPKVSVCVVTYNQEKYIAQCLQSLVDQETDFPFEIIVGDDCSTDGTRAIVLEFSKKYPLIIKLVLQAKNLGPTGNYFSIHNMAMGDYVAHLDGDDYALPNKLQVLKNHMDVHIDCSIVWHRMYVLNEVGKFAVGMPVTPVLETLGKSKLYLEDLALYYGLTGCQSGSMYRKSEKKIFNHREELIDYYVTLSLCSDGQCAMYIDRPFGVYRFIASDNTLTRSKGSVVTGSAKLRLIRDYLVSNPSLGRYFASQCLFEIFLRSFLHFPLVYDYLKMFFKCRSFPAVKGLFLVFRVFMRNRNSKLRRAFGRM